MYLPLRISKIRGWSPHFWGLCPPPPPPDLGITGSVIAISDDLETRKLILTQEIYIVDILTCSSILKYSYLIMLVWLQNNNRVLASKNEQIIFIGPPADCRDFNKKNHFSFK